MGGRRFRRPGRGHERGGARADRPRHRPRRPRFDPRQHPPRVDLREPGHPRRGRGSVSIYQTNSPEECHYVLDHSESRAVFVEDGEQLAKIREVASDLPALELVIVMEPTATSATRSRSTSCGERGRAARSRARGAHRQRHPGRRLRVHLHVGNHRPAEGRDPHPRQLPRDGRLDRVRGAIEGDEVTYLFLPLAHAFALLVQFIAVDLGGVIAYWEKDPRRSSPT